MQCSGSGFPAARNSFDRGSGVRGGLAKTARVKARFWRFFFKKCKMHFLKNLQAAYLKKAVLKTGQRHVCGKKICAQITRFLPIACAKCNFFCIKLHFAAVFAEQILHDFAPMGRKIVPFKARKCTFSGGIRRQNASLWRQICPVILTCGDYSRSARLIGAPAGNSLYYI